MCGGSFPAVQLMVYREGLLLQMPMLLGYDNCADRLEMFTRGQSWTGVCSCPGLLPAERQTCKGPASARSQAGSSLWGAAGPATQSTGCKTLCWQLCACLTRRLC